MLNDGVPMLLYGAAAFVAAFVIAVAFGVFLHAEKLHGHWVAPLFVPLIVFGIAAGALLSGRDLTYASIDIGGINAPDGGRSGDFLLRVINFALIGLGSAKVFGWLMRMKKGPEAGGRALYVAFMAYFATNVVLNSIFGAYPTFVHGSYYFLAVASGVYFARGESLDLVVRFARTALLCFLLAGLLAALVRPSLAVQPSYEGWIPGLSYRLWGLGSNPNSIGPLALLFLVLHYMQPYSRKWLRYVGVCASLLVLTLAQSKTGWVAGIAAAAILVWYRSESRSERSFSKGLLLALLAMIVAGTLIAVAAEPAQVWQRFALTKAGSEFQTLTGRAQIWAAALDAWYVNPLFGYGPNAWGVEHRIQIGMPFAFSAHNQFLQTLSVGGAMGLVAFLAYFLLLGVGAWRAMSETRAVSFALFLIVATRTLTEAPLTMGTLLNGDALTHVLLLAFALRGFQLASSNERYPVMLSPGMKVSAS